MKTLFLVVYSLTLTSLVLTRSNRIKKTSQREKRIKEAMEYFLNIKEGSRDLLNRKLHNFSLAKTAFEDRSHVGYVKPQMKGNRRLKVIGRTSRHLRKTKTHKLKEELSLLKNEFKQLKDLQHRSASLQPAHSRMSGFSNQSFVSGIRTQPSRVATDLKDHSAERLSSEIAEMKDRLNMLEAELLKRSKGKKHQEEGREAHQDPLINFGLNAADTLGIKSKLDAYAAGTGAAALAYGSSQHDKLKAQQMIKLKKLEHQNSKLQAYSKVLDEEKRRFTEICDEISRAGNKTGLVQKNLVFRLQQRIDNLFY